jgi:hypothetical protein
MATGTACNGLSLCQKATLGETHAPIPQDAIARQSQTAQTGRKVPYGKGGTVALRNLCKLAGSGASLHP